MADITLRSVKGTGLTNSEIDANFTALNQEVGTKAAADHSHTLEGLTGLSAEIAALLATNNAALTAAVATSLASKADKAVIWVPLDTDTHVFTEADADVNYLITNVDGCYMSGVDALPAGWASGRLKQGVGAGQITLDVDGEHTIGSLSGSLVSSGERSICGIFRDTADSFHAWGELGGVPWSISLALSDLTTVITAGVLKAYFDFPFDFTLTEVIGGLVTASSSGVPTWDVNKNTASVLSTKLTIDASETSSLNALAPAVISDAAFVRGDRLTVDIDTSGTGTKGAQITFNGFRTS
jgi:hypothetical protein